MVIYKNAFKSYKAGGWVNQGCGVGVVESESEGILGGVRAGVGKMY
jgi:hypothetical protein